MFDWLLEVFSTRGFMPHGHCYLWSPGLLWLQVLTNAAIGLSYFAISGTLAYLVYRIRDIPFKAVYAAFGIFIVTCGLTHFSDVWVIWYPDYWVDGGIRLLTALASVGTAVLLPPLIPKAEAIARGAKAAHDRGMELEGMVRDLERMYEQATELDEVKTQLFANVSHELRTPIALILGPLQRLAARTDLTAEERQDLEVADRNARVLLRHVEELLEVARVEAGQLELQYTAVDLAVLVRTCVAQFEGTARDRGLSITLEAPRSLRAEVDAPRIRRVVQNLLSNAVKFTPDEGRIRVRLEAVTRASSPAAVLEVADSGPGIPPAQRQVIFERFRQLQGGASRPFGGTGLGLSIVRDVVEHHQGSVSVSEAPEGGALFRVEVPGRAPDEATVREAPPEAAPEPIPAAPTAPDDLPAPPAADAPLALVVEDNPDMRRFVAQVLAHDLAVVTAEDGEEGLATALDRRPDIIVSDVMMPRMSGDQLVRAVRADASLDGVPILLLTARTDDALRVDLLRSGAQDWLVKPFQADELLARVGNLVQVKRARDVLQRSLDSRDRDLVQLATALSQRDRELGDAAAELEIARDYAERASQLKTRFLRVVSHELRTPLNVLGLQIELLRRVAGGAPEPQEIAGRMRQTLDRMTELVDALLHRARLDGASVRLALEDFDLQALAAEVMDDHRARAEAHGLTLELVAPELPPLRSDRQLVRLVLWHLIGNAVKFTAHGSVRLELAWAEGCHWMTVQDTGPGIPEADLQRIFSPFEQLENVDNKHVPGVGLGLSLVHEIVHALAGEVTVRSSPGDGAVFTVRIPEPGHEARLCPPEEPPT